MTIYSLDVLLSQFGASLAYLILMTALWGMDNYYAHFQMRTVSNLPKVTQVENDRAVFGTAVQLYYKKMEARVQWQLTTDSLDWEVGVIDDREEEDLGG